jgi:predicted PurR-regulated permease PerM
MFSPALARNVLTTTITVVAVICGLLLLYLLRRPISWLVIATFVSVALSGPVAWLANSMRRGFAITLCFLGLLLIPAAMIAVIVPPLVTEGSSLVDHLPRYANDAEDWVNKNETLNKLDDQYDITSKIQDYANKLPSKLGDAASWLGDLGLGLVNSLFAAVTILIMTAFMLSNGPRWRRRLLELQPPERAARIGPTIDRMAQAVGAYVAGALLQAVVAGITTFIVLTILGVPFAGPLAVVSGVFDLIPMVGATIAAVFVGIVTVFGDFPLDTIVWIVWAIAYQQIENNLIQPRIQNRAVGVHPFGVIVAVLFGAELLGIPGALLAVPVAASIQILIQDWWRWRTEQRAATTTPALPPPAD